MPVWAPLFGSKGTFYGGIFLPSEKQATRDRPLETLAVPSFVCVPLSCAEPDEATLIVRPGESVRCGQRIAGDDEHPVYATVDGIVESPGLCDTPDALDVPCVRIRSQRAAVPTVRDAVTVADLDALIRHAATSNLIEQDTTNNVLADRLHAAKAKPPHDLIISGLESDPCLTVEWRLMHERTDDVTRGAKRLGKLLGATRIWLAIDAEEQDLFNLMEAATLDKPIRLAPLVNKYPQDRAPLLIKAILGREIPLGRADLDVGAFVTRVATIAAIEASLRTGMPNTHCWLTVTGDAAAKPGNYIVPIGTPIRHILEHIGRSRAPRRLVAGSPMTGRAIEHPDCVVTAGTSGILLMAETGPHRFGAAATPQACTRCGWCLDYCPVGLDPHALLHVIELRAFERFDALHGQACIDCGLCSFVCPSNLPIAESIRAIQNGRRTATG